MKTLGRWAMTIVAAVISLGASRTWAADAVPSFTLKDPRGKAVSLADYANSKAVVLCFLGTECPLAKQYAPRLSSIAKEYEPKGVTFLGIDSNQQDSIAEMAAFARDNELSFPFLKDLGNQVADQAGATRTPEVVVLDSARKIRYQGRIDDQFGLTSTGGYAKPKLSRSDLKAALDELLSGKEISVAKTKAAGCLIGKKRNPKSDSPITYSKQIARLFQKHCVDCHRAGEIAPFALTSYDEVAGWAEMIDEVVREQRMPPWHASKEFGHWANDIRLTEEDKKMISDWVAAGAPEGNAKDLPEPKRLITGWGIPQPDKVIWITEKPVPVAAEGTIEYKYFTVDPGLKEDVWVRAADCRVSNRSVVHHIICFVQDPGVKSGFQGNEPVNLWLLHGFAPGMPALNLPEGTAFHIKAGSKFVFQMHYTPNGTSTEDHSQMGFVYADPKSIKHNARTWNAINPYFVIPPNANNHKVEATHKFSRDALLISLMPHMHLRGKSFRYDLIYPDGTKETILDVPRYDFNWQNVYSFVEPKRVPAGTKMHCIAHFDNSEENLANPDPKKRVTWGDQTWEEMMIGWFTMSPDVDVDSTWPGGTRTQRTLEFVKADPSAARMKAGRGASKTITNPKSFDGFARMLSEALQQVDRICVTTLEGESTKVELAYQSATHDVVVGRSNKRLPQGALAKIIASGQPAALNNLSERSEPDLALLGKVYRSSYHVPINWKGKPAIVSFWSRESDAFPAEIQEILAATAKRISN